MKRNPFRKLTSYRGFFKGSILNVFAFRLEIYGWIAQQICALILMVFLWFAIYSSTGNVTTSINGMTYYQMIYYQAMVIVTTQWTNQSASFDILTDDIREGNVSISLTKPVSYRGRCLSCTLGREVANFVLFALPMFIVISLIFTFGLGMEFPSIWNLLMYLVAGILAIILFDSFDFLLGQFGFVTNSLFGIYIIKNTLIMFLSGGMIPFSFFPESIQPLLNYLPFSGIASTPINIYLGNYSYSESLIKLAISLSWTVGLYVLTVLVNRRMIRHVEVAGG